MVSRSARAGPPLGCSAAQAAARTPVTVTAAPGRSSTVSTVKRRWTAEEPGNMHSIASGRRRARPGGPTTVSGRVRRVNCPSRIRNGSPPKWSPCRWDTNTAAISPGSSPLRRSALSEVAPQSSSTGAAPPGPRRWMQAWYRPPLPKASPEPANVTVTSPAPGEELTGPFWPGPAVSPEAAPAVLPEPAPCCQRPLRQSRRSGGGPRLGGGSGPDGGAPGPDSGGCDLPGSAGVLPGSAGELCGSGRGPSAPDPGPSGSGPGGAGRGGSVPLGARGGPSPAPPGPAAVAGRPGPGSAAVTPAATASSRLSRVDVRNAMMPGLASANTTRRPSGEAYVTITALGGSCCSSCCSTRNSRDRCAVRAAEELVLTALEVLIPQAVLELMPAVMDRESDVPRERLAPWLTDPVTG